MCKVHILIMSSYVVIDFEARCAVFELWETTFVVLVDFCHKICNMYFLQIYSTHWYIYFVEECCLHTGMISI